MLLGTAILAHGDVIPADNVKQASKQIKQKCTKGCLVLSPEEVANIEQNIYLGQKAAFEKGKNSCNGNI